MSGGTNYTQMSYECSRQSATISNDEDFSTWTNEFKEGIELKKGDQVRLLGSFVHQGSTAEEIEIERDMELNISYSPFLKADTIDTLDSTASGSLQDLSDICDLTYGTDSFGIEPPQRITTQTGGIIGDFTNAQKQSFPNSDATFPKADGQPDRAGFTTVAYTDPIVTGEIGGDFYGLGRNSWNINSTVASGASDPNGWRGDNATVFGTNVKTNQIYSDQNKKKQDYSNFKFNRANCEMYMGSMVKKLILPVFDNFVNYNTTDNSKGDPVDDEPGPTSRTLDPLLLDPPEKNIGMLNGMPKPGMCIATVNIAQSSGWIDGAGNCYYENHWDVDDGPRQDYLTTSSRTGDKSAGVPFRYAGSSGHTGIPNLAAGLESVIGTIIASRPVIHNINGKSTDCWEVMVSDFVNPASVSNKNIIKSFDPNRLTRADNFGTVATSTTQIKVFKNIHGSGENDTNTNFNPSINNINGAFNQITTATGQTGGERESAIDGYKCGMMSNTPLRNNYLLNSPINGPNFRTDLEQGGTTPNASYYQMGLGQPQGLSFLWNGSHTGYLRYNKTVSNVDRYRANHLSHWQRQTATPNQLDAVSKINDIRLVVRAGSVGNSLSFDRTAELMEMGSVPVCMGAYIICKKETMLDIAKGVYSDISQYWNQVDTGQPRIWFDYAYQQAQSNYTTRHYVGNSYDTSYISITNTPSAGPPVDVIFPRGSGFDGSIPPFFNEKRYGYAMCGRPLNINYRASSGESGLPDITNSQDINDISQVAGGCGVSQETATSVGDFMPRYYNTPSGTTAIFSPTGTETTGMRGLPSVWGGYNTSINSIYFQQKETGDTLLGSKSQRATGVCAINTDITVTPKTINITIDSLFIEGTTTQYTPIPGDFVRVIGVRDCQFHNVSEIGAVTLYPGTSYYTIDLATHSRFYADIPSGTKVIISTGKSYMPKALGINGNAWASDHIMIKEQLIKIKIQAGFYTEDQLGERINDQIHYRSQEFKRKFGIQNADGTFAIPGTVGNKEEALCSQPSIINGNFVGTYIPDITFAFSPVTVNNSATLNLTASTKEITNELYTYEPLELPIVYYFPEHLPTVSTEQIIVKLLSDNSYTNSPTTIGKHFKIYTVPEYDLEEPAVSDEITLTRLRGGSLNTKLDFISDTPAVATSPKYWHNKITRFAGTYEMLRAFEFSDDTTGSGDSQVDYPQDGIFSTLSLYSYRTRLTRNIFPSGGSARCFMGANNFTFSWESGANRFSFNNLYTPLRPHKPETSGTDAKEDFGIGDAIPSGVVNSRPNGTLITQLSGIYINNLNGDLFTQENWGVATVGNAYLYDTITTQERILKNTTFLNILGFTLDQLDGLKNSFNEVSDIFLFKDTLIQSGTAIRVGAKITTAINASNPIASKCLAIAPVTQFMVQLDTDDFFARNSPLKGNDPYFFIGSTFPFKQFHGNENGAKLPIMGICARNFQAFGFSFDLGGSAVSYLIEENTTITSIKTKIYTSQLQTPANLSPYSSIIYLITRYDYLKNLTPQQGELQLQQTIANMNRPMINAFNSPPLAMARTAPPVNPDRYYYTGYPTNQMETIEEQEDDDDY